MPLLTIETNQSTPTHKVDELLKSASKVVANMLGKSESYVMVRFCFNENMLFAGSEEALAYLQLKSIGLPESATAQLSAALCEHMESHLHLPKDRIYIEFVDAPRKMWGYNGSTF
jgi:phenylpyruvate tautomerase PptA (4-oxalocrotonate tautomerase family)